MTQGTGPTSLGATGAQKGRMLRCRVIEAATAVLFEQYVDEYFGATSAGATHTDGRAAGTREADIVHQEYSYDGTNYRLFITYAKG